MRQRNTSPILWVLFGVCIVAVLGLGLWLMPRLRAATTYVPPTQTPVPPTPVPTNAPPTSSPAQTTSPTSPPTGVPTSSLGVAPDFTLPGANGTEVTLSEQLAEGPVVLTFFRSVGGWRPEQQLVELQKHYGAFQAAGAKLISLVVASLEAVEGLCERAQVPYPVLSDADHGVSQAYGVYDLLGDGLAAPAVFVIDRDGRVVWSQVGQRFQEPVPAATILERLP
jgi:peroxiredoxin